MKNLYLNNSFVTDISNNTFLGLMDLQLLDRHVDIDALQAVLGTCPVSFDDGVAPTLGLLLGQLEVQGALEADLVFLKDAIVFELL